MKISSNNLDVVAWYIFVRSGQRHVLQNGSFKASSFIKTLIVRIIPFLIQSHSKEKNFNEDNLVFYTNLQIESEGGDLDSIEKTLSSFLRKDHDSLDFRSLPNEIETAVKLFLNKEENGDFYTNQPELNFCNQGDLKNFGLEEIYLNELIREYIKLDESIYVAISGDGSSQVMSNIKDQLYKYADVSYQTEIQVTERGKRQWVRLQYAHESHWDERNMSTYMSHPYHGVRISGNSVGLIFFKKKDFNHNIRDLKELVRNDLGQDFPHVHFPDTHKEVTWMANASFNKNSISWMNQALDEYPKGFKVLMPEYKSEISNREDHDKFSLDSGMVLALYGIRDTSDIDYIYCGDTEKPIVNARMESHNTQYEGYKDTQEIIESPSSHFFYKDIKFCTLQEVKGLKECRSKLNPKSPNSLKDRKDIKLIDKYLLGIQNQDSKVYSRVTEVSNYKKEIQKQKKLNFNFISSLTGTNFYLFLKFITPAFVRRFIRNFYISYLMKEKKKLTPRIPNILG